MTGYCCEAPAFLHLCLQEENELTEYWIWVNLTWRKTSFPVRLLLHPQTCLQGLNASPLVMPCKWQVRHIDFVPFNDLSFFFYLCLYVVFLAWLSHPWCGSSSSGSMWSGLLLCCEIYQQVAKHVGTRVENVFLAKVITLCLQTVWCLLLRQRGEWTTGFLLNLGAMDSQCWT